MWDIFSGYCSKRYFPCGIFSQTWDNFRRDISRYIPWKSVKKIERKLCLGEWEFVFDCSHFCFEIYKISSNLKFPGCWQPQIFVRQPRRRGLDCWSFPGGPCCRCFGRSHLLVHSHRAILQNTCRWSLLLRARRQRGCFHSRTAWRDSQSQHGSIVLRQWKQHWTDAASSFPPSFKRVSLFKDTF